MLKIIWGTCNGIGFVLMVIFCITIGMSHYSSMGFLESFALSGFLMIIGVVIWFIISLICFPLNVILWPILLFGGFGRGLDGGNKITGFGHGNMAAYLKAHNFEYDDRQNGEFNINSIHHALEQAAIYKSPEELEHFNEHWNEFDVWFSDHTWPKDGNPPYFGNVDVKIDTKATANLAAKGFVMPTEDQMEAGRKADAIRFLGPAKDSDISYYPDLPNVKKYLPERYKQMEQNGGLLGVYNRQFGEDGAYWLEAERNPYMGTWPDGSKCQVQFLSSDVLCKWMDNHPEHYLKYKQMGIVEPIYRKEWKGVAGQDWRKHLKDDEDLWLYDVHNRFHKRPYSSHDD